MIFLKQTSNPVQIVQFIHYQDIGRAFRCDR